MKKLVLMNLVLLLVACTAPIAIVESPGQVKAPDTPTPPVAPTVTTTSAPAPVDCQTACQDRCYPNADKVCGKGTSYDDCVANCGTYLRPEGCKASCATEATAECVIVFKGQCKIDCKKACAAA